MRKRNHFFRMALLLLIVAYISPTVAAMILGAIVFKHLYEAGHTLH